MSLVWLALPRRVSLGSSPSASWAMLTTEAELGIASLAHLEQRCVTAIRRIEAMKATKLKEKQKTFAVIQSRRIKALRKLANARKLIEAPKESIIDEYHNYSSKVYAPQTRQGQFADLKPRGDVDPKPFEPANYK
eukprot:gene25322-30911_t